MQADDIGYFGPGRFSSVAFFADARIESLSRIFCDHDRLGVCRVGATHRQIGASHSSSAYRRDNPCCDPTDSRFIFLTGTQGKAVPFRICAFIRRLDIRSHVHCVLHWRRIAHPLPGMGRAAPICLFPRDSRPAFPPINHHASCRTLGRSPRTT